MIDFDITFEAKSLLKLLYGIYLGRRHEGKGRTESNQFGSSADIQKSYLPNMKTKDVTDLCFELAHAGCIHYSRGDNLANFISLTYEALVYCEQEFKRNFKEMAEWISSIKGMLPI
ncbi:hypothetical protein [Subdoligranulum variabile]|nr:hypothetical protein [Subdoligranulum variabile]UWP68688.1 hypothetical protein NQ490_02230 [Subdoligranulum variabile]